MTIYGIDLHPRYQAGINIERARAEGVEFMAVKVSDGTSTTPFEGAFDWLRRGQACGMLCLGYHYLQPGNEPAQAQVFASQLARAGVPGMVDAEALTAAGRPSLTVPGVRSFVDHALAFGVRVPLLYLPRWYHQRLGNPSLVGLPTLWASSYPSRSTGSPAQLYPAVTRDRWAGYGGLPVGLLQFAETGVVAGKTPVDLNAYLGTRDQLAGLLGITPTTHTPEPLPVQASARRPDLEDTSMFHRTPAPDDWTSAKDTWPAERISVGLDPPGGWGGRAILKVTTSEPGGWIHEAQWWRRHGTGVGTPNAPHDPVPISPIPGGNERFVGFQLEIEVPARCDEIALRLAAPGGVHIAPYYER